MINELSNKLQELFEVKTKDLSIKSGLVQRSSKLTGSILAKGIVFGFQRNADSSINQLTRMISSFGISISEQGLDKRFSQKSANFFRLLLNEAISIFNAENKIDSGLFKKLSDLKITDSTIITLPYELINEWTGSGNRLGSKANSAMKISATLSLKSGSLNIVLEDGFVQDKDSEIITSEIIEPQGLYIKDLGYYNNQYFEMIDKKGGYFSSRLKIQNKVISHQGQTIDIVKLMKGKNAIDKQVFVGKNKLPCRLLIMRLPEEIKKERLLKLQKEAVRKQQKLSEKKISLSEFNIFITNIPVEKLSFNEVLVLMKARWQIELLFKLWKSYCKLDESRSKKPYRILTELYAKMIGILISHQLMIIGFWNFIDRSLFKAIKVIQDNVSVLVYAFNKGTEQIKEAINFITSIIKSCRIDKREQNPALFELISGHKEINYA